MTETHRKSRQGFTLIELMIVIAINVILDAIALQSFLQYQNRSKRSEAYVKLKALDETQQAYFAEFGDYIGVVAEPTGSTGTPPTRTKRDVTGVSAAFGAVGWTPEGDVFFDYDTNTSDLGCACVSCFTAAAYGDLDGNMQLSVMLFVQPDINEANWCQTALVAQDPPLNAQGQRIFHTVVRSVLSDEF